MSQLHRSSYDEVPYEDLAFYHVHPDCIATVALLCGLQPPPLAACRVLDLGCAGGGNLLPMAQNLPESRFVGIDLSPGQVARGQAVASTLGLANVELRALSILDLDDSLGQFDYILCHGVYSWVPAAVRDKILQICKRNLAPNGIAYISYNAYPGWHSRGLLRDMLSFHDRPADSAEARVRRMRDFMESVIGSLPDPKSIYGLLLQEEHRQMKEESDSYLFHEHLEDVNDPIYFYQFADRASAHGLQYLGEARFHTMATSQPPPLQERLHEWSADLIRREQYLDFLQNRSLRQTLLCHDHVVLNRTPSVEGISRLHARCQVEPVSAQPDLASTQTEQFRLPDGGNLSTNHPVFKTALCCLGEAWPLAVPFPELWARIMARLAPLPEPNPARNARDTRLLAVPLLQCFMSNLLELHANVPPFVGKPGERPLTTSLIRHHAGHGQPVTNMFHLPVELNERERLVLSRLDGNHDRQALTELLRSSPAQEGTGNPDEDLESILNGLAGQAVLVG